MSEADTTVVNSAKIFKEADMMVLQRTQKTQMEEKSRDETIGHGELSK